MFPNCMSSRVAARLTVDHISTLFPDVSTPFRDAEDVVDRLLPYHIFHHPREDLLRFSKGKHKATETEILQSELAETKLALECFKRRRALEERFRRARTKSGKAWPFAYNRPGSLLTFHQCDGQAYYLEQQVLDCERAEHSALNTELRNAKAELERVTRMQRLAALPQRTNYYPSAAPIYTHHYRTYHYPYTQTYAAPAGSATSTQGYSYSVPLNSAVTQYVPLLSRPSASSPISPSTPASAPIASGSGVSSAIPVQLPVSSLPTLHALGIVPVPTQSLSADSPTPPAVLRGTSANGTMLNLEINVSLLQAAQMSGLALVLNSIMRGSANASTVEVPPHAQVGAPYTYPYTAGRSLVPTTTAAPHPIILTIPDYTSDYTYSL
ncbi:hypothetical protein B0F90DRAFT_1720831 [Multifurca ochricompacta]|uniref:GLTSCR protein conserved domain-containing protein n=1 Tax=Multifurca ochricompacta TaxID=376703 RepID=A0AAD4M402_9AGAM|nr:hypothetical protein B0F90DRAFT_1720831 [Multifurca ochricompacta]